MVGPRAHPPPRRAQDLGWRSGGRYLSRRDDISTVAYWYQSEPFTDFPPLPSRDALEIV